MFLMLLEDVVVSIFVFWDFVSCIVVELMLLVVVWMRMIFFCVICLRFFSVF